MNKYSKTTYKLYLSGFVVLMVSVLQSGQAAGTPVFNWEVPDVRVWSWITTGTARPEETFSDFQKGGRQTALNKEIAGNTVFGISKTTLADNGAPQSGIFTEQVLAQVGYQPKTPPGKEPETWDARQWHAYAGISLKQGFTVKADTAIVNGFAQAWGTGGELRSQYIYNLLGADWSVGSLLWNIKISDLNGFEPWSGLTGFEIKQNPIELLQQFEAKFSAVGKSLRVANFPSDMVTSAVSLIDQLRTSVQAQPQVGDAINKPIGGKSYKPAPVQYTTGQRYQLEFDIIAEASQMRGAWARVNAFNSFHSGIWIGNAPKNDPTIPEPSTLPLLGIGLVAFFPIMCPYRRRV